MITVDKLVFEYPGLKALDNVSFHIPAGNITALVGPNGAGKTTLLRCMAALEQPVSGHIQIDGINVLEHPRECHRKIGYLSDFFGLYQRLTVYQCLHYVARAQGIAEHDCPNAIADTARRLHIEERLNMLPGELSRGLRQRVAIAQAIIHRPSVVLLDEPASGLDPEARHELAELFLDLRRAGMNLLVSSHILAELEAYCSDMLVLRQGRIIERVVINATTNTQSYKLVLAHPVESFRTALLTLSNINIVRLENDCQAIVEFDADALQQHHILKSLLAMGLPVCEFAPSVANLQDTYLHTIRQPS